MRLAQICVLVLNLTPDATNAQGVARSRQGAMIRTLDKVSGRTSDLEFGLLQRHSIGKLQIELTDCRYPADNPSGDAFAQLDIRERSEERRVGKGCRSRWSREHQKKKT